MVPAVVKTTVLEPTILNGAFREPDEENVNDVDPAKDATACPEPATEKVIVPEPTALTPAAPLASGTVKVIFALLRLDIAPGLYGISQLPGCKYPYPCPASLFVIPSPLD